VFHVVNLKKKPLVNLRQNVDFLPKIFPPHSWRSNAWLLQVSPKMLFCYLSLLGFPIVWWFKVANIFKLMILSHGGKIGCAFYWDIDF